MIFRNDGTLSPRYNKTRQCFIEAVNKNTGKIYLLNLKYYSSAYNISTAHFNKMVELLEHFGCDYEIKQGLYKTGDYIEVKRNKNAMLLHTFLL